MDPNPDIIRGPDHTNEGLGKAEAWACGHELPLGALVDLATPGGIVASLWLIVINLIEDFEARKRRIPMARKSKKPKGQTKTKIKFSELVARVQSGKITEDDCRRYFHAVYEGTEPFKPSLGIRESEVDLTGIRRTARAAGAELGFEASEVVRQRRMAATRSKRAAGKAGAAMGAAGWGENEQQELTCAFVALRGEVVTR